MGIEGNVYASPMRKGITSLTQVVGRFPLWAERAVFFINYIQEEHTDSEPLLLQHTPGNMADGHKTETFIPSTFEKEQSE